MPQARPISRGLYQLVSKRTQGGTPAPWKRLFKAQHAMKNPSPEPSPNTRFTHAENNKPSARR